MSSLKHIIAMVLDPIFNRLHRLQVFSRRKTQLALFCQHGDSISIGDKCEFIAAQNISLGRCVYIGPEAWFSAENSKILIGNKVLIGPRVAIICGDHNVSCIGKYMFDAVEKLSSNDQPVIIEDDVWLGYGTIILKGVTVGRGSVIAAGSVVTRNIAPYSIAAGVPCRTLRKRFSADQIITHEQLLKQNISY